MPNIAIYEGGKAARMNGVSRITTDDGNDGKIVWVPQSDRQTGTLYVSENGTYRAEDEGLHSWSKVTVRLAGAPLGLEVPTLPDPITGAEIPTGELGELDPVPPAGLEPIEDEPISTEEAESIIEEAGLDPSDLDPDSPNYDDAIDAIADATGTDPDKVKVVDPEKKEDVKKEQPKVEDKGQVIAGTDPETGETTTITPSGKEKKVVPVAIVITKMPKKLAYNSGERIDLTGLEIRLYSKYEETEKEGGGTKIDAVPYKDNRYPDGIVPISEVTCTPDTAEADGEMYEDRRGVKAVLLSFGGESSFPPGRDMSSSSWAAFYRLGEPVYPHVSASASGVQIYMTFFYETDGGTFTLYTQPVASWSGFSGFGGKNNYRYATFGHTAGVWKDSGGYGNIPNESGFGPITAVRPSNVFEPYKTTMEVGIEWVSPYDGKTLATSYTVSVIIDE